jgi:hypothetical protein
MSIAIFLAVDSFQIDSRERPHHARPFQTARLPSEGHQMQLIQNVPTTKPTTAAVGPVVGGMRAQSLHGQR